MKNNEAHNARQSAERVKRATKLARRKQRGESVDEIAASLKITPARVYKLIASIK